MEHVPAFAASVIVPSHKGAHRLPSLLDALARQNATEPWELVVVLDGILDDSEQVLEQWRDQLHLRVIAYPQSRGVIHALNLGYAQAGGRVLIRCDDDLSPGPDMIRRHLAHHLSEDGVGVMGATRDVYPDTPYAIAYGRPATARSLQAAYSRLPADRWIGWAAHNSVTREVWDRVGGFDPRFVYGQDSELGYRLAVAGVQLSVDPELELEHRGPALDTATRAPRAFVSGASRRLFETVHGQVHPQGETVSGLRARAWTATVGTVAAVVRTREGFARGGQLVDELLRLVPRRFGGLLVALLIEAAGLSGSRHGRTDLSAYRDQKSAELARETMRDHNG